MGREHRGLRGLMKDALRLIYPPQCLGCGNGVGEDGALCHDCWREAQFITGAACHRCGAPLADDGAAVDGAEMTLICDGCMAIARPWQQGRAALVYAGTGRALALAFKHGDRPDLAPALAGWLARSAAPMIQPDMLVVPVPIHWRRLLKRKYNQAELLAAHLAARHRLPHEPDMLRRTRATAGQDHRSVSDRFDNVAGAIEVNPRHAPRLRDRPVLLVDDVMASGATLTACSEALQMAGSGPVSVAVLARAVRSD